MELRQIFESEIDQLRVWRNNPKLYKWFRQNKEICAADHRRWFYSQRTDSSIQMRAITVDAKLIGVCGLTSIDRYNSRAEFSLYIGPEFWGHGYGEMALIRLLNMGLNVEGLNLIWGETFEGNRAAKMFERVGFTKEGTRREFYLKNGKHIGAHLYSITKGEFNRAL